MNPATIDTLLLVLTVITVALAVCALLLLRRGALARARTCARLALLTIAPYLVLMGLLVHALRDDGESKAATLARCIAASMNHGVLAVPALWLAAFVRLRANRPTVREHLLERVVVVGVREPAELLVHPLLGVVARRRRRSIRST